VHSLENAASTKTNYMASRHTTNISENKFTILLFVYCVFSSFYAAEVVQSVKQFMVLHTAQ